MSIHKMMAELLGVSLVNDLTIESLVKETQDGGARIVFSLSGLEIYAVKGGIYVFDGEPMSFSKTKASSVLALLTLPDDLGVWTEAARESRATLINVMSKADNEEAIETLNKLLAEGVVDALEMNAAEVKEANENRVDAMEDEGITLDVLIADNTEDTPTIH